MKYEFLNNGTISLSLDITTHEDRCVKEAIKRDTKAFYNHNTKVWTVYGFDTLTRFEKFIGRAINGERTSVRGIAPTKKATQEQQKAFWKSEEGKALKEKRKMWVIQQNEHKFQYITEKWDIATATVIEDNCRLEKKPFYKLTDNEIIALACKYEDRITEVFMDMMF